MKWRGLVDSYRCQPQMAMLSDVSRTGERDRASLTSGRMLVRGTGVVGADRLLRRSQNSLVDGDEGVLEEVLAEKTAVQCHPRQKHSERPG